jgi:hypothetical protein
MKARWPELLSTYLDSLEYVIAQELADPSNALERRGKAIPGASGASLRQLDLTQALQGIAAAREELGRCPEGAQLAMLVSAIELGRLRLPVETERARYNGAKKGATAPKGKRTQDAARLHQKIRREAKKIQKRSPNVKTAAGKATLLSRKFKLSEGRIRHIIAKPKPKKSRR